MFKLSRVPILIITIALIFSCSKKAEKKLNYEIKIKDGIEYVINENRSSIPIEALKINLKKSFVINGMDTMT